MQPGHHPFQGGGVQLRIHIVEHHHRCTPEPLLHDRQSCQPKPNGQKLCLAGRECLASRHPADGNGQVVAMRTDGGTALLGIQPSRTRQCRLNPHGELGGVWAAQPVGCMIAHLWTSRWPPQELHLAFQSDHKVAEG